ncbi:DNA-directed RNA polymerase subunit alpha [Patescibacteria group bacterium]|nr:DNA-directed RNA polymerase subunit alpha [Patescibacteria group bacterium]MBU4452843.1 DNA-directed RNA polymerase subunit alpha [Patescibacteria group bacterium]MCG2687247.1 DNA-directed RNA polymerase subunit alpha [Candidatus Parcubacteria bacterium]
MENILLPSKMTFSPGSHEHEEILTIEPLHHGYGTTIGNALRRVLLSSLEGSAVTGVKIKGVQHEFSAITGVKEDVLEIILNLKQLRMKMHSDNPITLSLTVDGKEGVVTAGDIEKNADIEIANKDLVIATVTSKETKLHMDIVVEKGRGFVPTEERDTASEIGMISVDSMFSPVNTVGLKIENTRVGEITNYDKVIMNIITDGTMTAQEAVEQATKIILNHFNWIEGQFRHSSLIPSEDIEESEAKEEDESEK